MKPPAATGASRDIFGADFTGTPSHNRVLKPPGGGSSDIFGSQQSDHEQQQNKQQARRNVKNHLASNLFLSDEPSQNAPTPSKTPESNGGDAHDGGSTEVKTNGNVATMNGTSAMNGNVKPMTNGNAGPVPATNGNAAPRQRVPPGGYSSGLW